MERLERIFRTIREQLSQLTSTQRMLVASVVVILLMTLFLVSQYAVRPQLVELFPAAAPDEQARAAQFLEINGIKHQIGPGGAPRVQPERKALILGQMAQEGQLPTDTTLLFNGIIDQDSWTMSDAQRGRMYNIALQNELARVISGFSGVGRATVIIDTPEQGGLGRAAREPTASATVFRNGAPGPMPQKMVNAISALVAGAKSGLEIASVRVIDAATNTQHKATGDDEALATTYLEHAGRVERGVREKLLDQLRYVENVIVQVNAHVDVRRTRTDRESVLAVNNGSQVFEAKTLERERTETSQRSAGESGVRPNTGLDPAASSGPSDEVSDTETETVNQVEPGRERTLMTDPGGAPTLINAVVSVPRSYMERVWRINTESGEDETPTPEQLQTVVDSESTRIEESVRPIVVARADDGTLMPGDIVVTMIPDIAEFASFGGAPGAAGVMGGGGGGGGGVMGLMASGMIKSVALGALALVSIAVMAMTLRKSSRRPDLPTPEELVGVPPSLRANEDLVGEAEEADAALAGVELTDVDVESRKRMDQVSELFDRDPERVATLLGGWIHPDD